MLFICRGDWKSGLCSQSLPLLPQPCITFSSTQPTSCRFKSCDPLRLVASNGTAFALTSVRDLVSGKARVAAEAALQPPDAVGDAEGCPPLTPAQLANQITLASRKAISKYVVGFEWRRCMDFAPLVYASGVLTLTSCSARIIRSKITYHPPLHIQSSSLNSFLSSYYEAWSSSDDPLMPYRSRNVCLRVREGSSVPGSNGPDPRSSATVHREISEMGLYTQVGIVSKMGPQGY